VSGRTALLIPDGWAPKRGSVVEVLATKDDPTPPAGTWRVFEQAPGTGTWWLTPTSDEARAWGKRWPNRVTSACVAVSGLQLVPKGYRPATASNLSDPSRMTR